MRSFLGLVAFSAAAVIAQGNQTRNLTPDGYWHNRYFAILSQGAYGDHETLCPNQSFTEETKLKNFPDSPLPPYTLIEEFGPTPMGGQGYSVVIPEMNKVVVIFKGNPQVEQTLPLALESVPWSYIGINGTCPGCLMNKYAADTYLEIRNATNNFALTRERYAGAGLVYAITGLGFGGMLSAIHSVDMNYELIAYYSHSQGAPRVFNDAGKARYDYMFNGEAGERAIFNNDQMSELIPASENYTHHGTTFKYWGLNETSNQPNWNICWPDVDPEALGCQPAPQMQQGVIPTPLQDHYWSFTPVTQCGSPLYNFTLINDFILANYPNITAADLPVPVPTVSSTRRPSYTSTARAVGSSVVAAPRASMLARWYGEE